MSPITKQLFIFLVNFKSYQSAYPNADFFTCFVAMTAHVLMDAGESFAYFETMDGSLEWLQVVLEGEKVKYDMRFYILYCLLSHKR